MTWKYKKAMLFYHLVTSNECLRHRLTFHCGLTVVHGEKTHQWPSCGTWLWALSDGQNITGGSYFYIWCGVAWVGVVGVGWGKVCQQYDKKTLQRNFVQFQWYNGCDTRNNLGFSRYVTLQLIDFSIYCIRVCVEHQGWKRGKIKWHFHNI